jgi:hypothetical protein
MESVGAGSLRKRRFVGTARCHSNAGWTSLSSRQEGFPQCLIQPAGTFHLQSGIDEVLSGTSEFILRTVPSMSKYVEPFGLSKAFTPHLSQ